MGELGEAAYNAAVNEISTGITGGTETVNAAAGVVCDSAQAAYSAANRKLGI